VFTSGDAPGITATHHNVIAGNIFLEAAHVVVRFAEWLNYANVIYGNYIGNDYHTALSLYQSGVGNPDDARHLVEYNFVRGSGENLELAQSHAGNALQWGSAENIYRYNIFTEGNIMDAAKSRNGASTISGAAGISSDQVYKCSRSRIYNNTVVYSGGPGWTCGVTQDTGGVPEAGDHFGLNKMVNNIFFDAYQYNVPWRQVEYENSLYPNHDDVWVRNIFGQPGVDSLTNLIAIFGTMYTVDEARTSRTAHPGPVFADWATPQATFRNEFKADLDTEDFVSYPGFSGAIKDYHLRAGSTLIDSGAPLTQVAAVTNATELVLDDTRFFYSEAADFRDNAPWIGIQLDHICIGPDATNVAAFGTECVALTEIDDASGTVQLASPVTTRPGEFVWLYRDSFGRRVVQGAAPDLGAAEFAAAELTACTPGTGELSWPFTFTLPTLEPGRVAACLDDTCSTRTACSQWTTNNCVAISGTSEYACTVVIKGLDVNTPYWFEYSTATAGTRQTPAQGQPGRQFY
jgi:hypothetical protein